MEVKVAEKTEEKAVPLEGDEIWFVNFDHHDLLMKRNYTCLGRQLYDCTLSADFEVKKIFIKKSLACR